MSNCVFGFPLHEQSTPLYTPVVSGGSWRTSLPLSNALDRRLSRIARSTDATTNSTIWLMDLGVSRGVGLISMLIPNLTKSSTPTVRFLAGTDPTFATFTTYDSGNVQAWPSGLMAEDVTGPDGTQMNVWSTVIPASVVNARYWGCNITDTGNADGYIDVARVIIAGAYRPSVCMQTGAKSGLEDDTVVSKTDGGAQLYQARAARRTDVFTLPNMPNSESVGTIRKMQHRLGKSGQVFFVWDETDPYRYERSYLATMRELGALEYSFSALYNSVGFELSEEL